MIYDGTANDEGELALIVWRWASMVDSGGSKDEEFVVHTARAEWWLAGVERSKKLRA